MARLLGSNIPDNKRIEYALTIIYGIGWTTAAKICKVTKINTHKKLGDLTEEEVKKITAVVENDYKIEGDLREERSVNIKRLREIGSYRGMRHSQELPSRGQRTRSNGRTNRGKRRTVGALSKEAWAKLDQNTTTK